jgi:hypothetical protein
MWHVLSSPSGVLDEGSIVFNRIGSVVSANGTDQRASANDSTIVKTATSAAPLQLQPMVPRCLDDTENI